MVEQWKPIQNYDGKYWVSNLGNIKNSTGLMKPAKSSNGYMHITLSKNGERRTMSVHRIVAEAFVENTNPSVNNVVNHKDESRDNNCADNLEWCTQQQNLLYGTYPSRNSQSRKALFANRDNNWRCIEVVCLNNGERFRSITDASEKYDIDKSSIAKVCRGERKTAGGYRWKQAPTIIEAEET